MSSTSVTLFASSSSRTVSQCGWDNQNYGLLAAVLLANMAASVLLESNSSRYNWTSDIF